VDWSEIFGISVSPWELIVRGTAMYAFLFLIFRVVVRRRVGSVGMADILVLVIIADAAQNGMSGEYRSVTEGAILVGTIIAWNVLADWATYKSEWMQRVLEPPPLLLIDNGKLLHRHLRMEFLSETELRSKLREHGVTDYREVQKAFMESDGQISVIKRQPA
jgi:uncharacterized membrane protein YcaP (DUF421 family)